MYRGNIISSYSDDWTAHIRQAKKIVSLSVVDGTSGREGLFSLRVLAGYGILEAK